MKIAIGSERFGLRVKDKIKDHLIGNGHEVMDFGMYKLEEPRSYIEVSSDVARAIQTGSAERGIVICSSGMGVAIVANKHKGIHCALVESVYTARLARDINDANVIALGGSIIGDAMALEMVDTFLTTEFGQLGNETRANLLRNLINDVKTVEDKNLK